MVSLLLIGLAIHCLSV